MEKKEEKTSPEISSETKKTPEYLDGQPGEITASLNELPREIKDSVDAFWASTGEEDPLKRKALTVGLLGWESLGCEPFLQQDDLKKDASEMKQSSEAERAFAKEVIERINVSSKNQEFKDETARINAYLETSSGQQWRAKLDEDLGNAGEESKVTREFFYGLRDVLESEPAIRDSHSVRETGKGFERGVEEHQEKSPVMSEEEWSQYVDSVISATRENRDTSRSDMTEEAWDEVSSKLKEIVAGSQGEITLNSDTIGEILKQTPSQIFIDNWDYNIPIDIRQDINYFLGRDYVAYRNRPETLDHYRSFGARNFFNTEFDKLDNNAKEQLLNTRFTQVDYNCMRELLEQSKLSEVMALPNGRSLLKKMASEAPGAFILQLPEFSSALGKENKSFLAEMAAESFLTMPEETRRLWKEGESFQKLDPEIRKKIDGIMEAQSSRSDKKTTRVAKKFVSGYPLENLFEFKVGTKKKRGKEFANDPSLKYLERVDPSFISDSYQKLVGAKLSGGKKTLANWQVMVARNLYFNGKEVTPENIKAEVSRIVETRKQVKDIPVFSERNVLSLSYEGESFFASKHPAFMKRIEEDGGEIIGDSRMDADSGMTVEDIKDKYLNSLATAEGPLTFIFRGHGSKEHLHLSKEVQISAFEFFDAYRERAQEMKDAPLQNRDIIINMGCYGANFIRNFYEMCDRNNVPKPIFISEAEYGQVAIGERDADYSDKFFENLFKGDGQATLGDVIDNDHRNPHSNPSFYIPDTQEETMQLAKRPGAPSVPGMG